jgi:hypothetical protein
MSDVLDLFLQVKKGIAEKEKACVQAANEAEAQMYMNKGAVAACKEILAWIMQQEAEKKE